jgi:hypothetical protein
MCRIPTFSQPDCTPDGGTPTSPSFQYFSGWTPDGRALDDISIALNVTSKIWPYVLPCSVYAAAAGPAGAGNASAAEAAFLSEHGFSCKEVAIPDSIPQLRIAALDFSALVANGKIPLEKLRLVPEVAQLQFLERFRAEGYPMQQSERTDTVTAGLSLANAHAGCS